MKRSTSFALPAASIAAIWATLIPATGLAQTAAVTAGAPTDTAATPDIIVTAQRREQRLQEVPIAITALGTEQLEQRGITDISGLAGAAPGVTVGTNAGVNSAATISIRGITGQDLAIGAGQAVAYYLDGVYLPRPDAAFFSLDDVQRIEVLRGPQGTLYGRNATGGAINIITRDPGNTLRGGADVAYGNYNAITARASISGPLGDGFSAGLSGSASRHDGYITNTVTGDKMNADKSYTVRGKLKYVSPDGRFDAVLSGNYSNDTATPVFKNAYAFPTSTYVGMGDPNQYSSDAQSEAETKRRITSKGVSLTMHYEASSALNLTSISSYEDTRTITGYDVDASAYPAIVVLSDNASKSFNQELRAVYHSKAIDLTVGGNYFHEDADFGLGTALPGMAIATNNPYDTSQLNAYAAFGQIEVHLTSQVTLVGGLRYNNEDRHFTVDYSQASPPGAFVAGAVQGRKLIPSAGINYQVTPDVLLYAKASQGYQAPGFNFAPGPTATSANTFGAETLWAYEVGAKTQFLDRRITLNAAAFRYDYSDIQIRSTVGVGLTDVSNAASARIQGAEASLTVTLPDGFSVGGQATYLDAKYGNFCQPISDGDPQGSNPLCAPGYANRDGNSLNQAPKWSGSVNAGYDAAIGTAGTLAAHVNYDFSSSQYYISAANEPLLQSGSYGILGARIGFTLPHGPELYIFGKNLTDKRYVGYSARISTNIIYQAFNDPRTYGVGIRYRF